MAAPRPSVRLETAPDLAGRERPGLSRKPRPAPRLAPAR